MSVALNLTSCAVDLSARVIVRDGQQHALTDHEAQLLAYLAERPGQAVGRDVLLQEVWGYSPSVHSRAVDQTIKRLRPKIEANPRDPAHLVTVKGVGYRLDVPDTSSETPSNVAPALDRFVGRQDELLHCRDHLKGAGRWLTVTGFGGMGKTRLAAEFARRFQADFPGGVWICDLSQAMDADAMIGMVAASMQLAPGSDTAGALTSLTGALNRSGQVLVVLDNLEQATTAAAELGHALLTAVPEARFLATSRARLGLRGEHVLALAPLDVLEGARLMVDRARRLRRDALWSTDDPNVIEIARRLEGLPLALELAAARVVLLSPKQLLGRLDHRLDVLRGGPPGRHQTLRQTIEWSWRLLSDAEKRALAYLGCFRGGFGIDEAERLVGTPDALDQLQTLVDRSLVQRLQGGRFGLLESIREFAVEQLQQTGEWDAAVDRHATILLELAAREELYDPTGWNVIGPLDPECDNLLAVAERQRDRHPEQSAQALLVAISLLRRRQSAAAICELIDRTLTLTLPDRLRSQLLQARAKNSSTPPVAMALMQQALDLAADSPTEQLGAALSWGRWLSTSGRAEDALRVFERAVPIAGDRHLELHVQIAIAHARMGHWDIASTSLRKLAKDAPSPIAAMPLHALGFAALEFNRIDVAADAFHRVFAVDPDREDLLVGLKGILALAQGNVQAAMPHLARSRAHSHALGHPGYMGEDDAIMGYIYHRMGDLDRADDLYRSAQVLLRSGGAMTAVAHVWAFRAVLEAERGAFHKAANALGEVEDWAAALAGTDIHLLARTLRGRLDPHSPRHTLDLSGRLPIEVRRLVAVGSTTTLPNSPATP
ncbi:MAG: winged helix-turn-helix domain-containing protein [Myxococcota bacterium]